MKNTIVVMSSNREVERQTRSTLQNLASLGAMLLMETGSADVASTQRRANLRATGAIHILRHTFCSHLAMKGAPALSIRHLAGHEDL